MPNADNLNTENESSKLLEALFKIDMTVEPYGVVKEFLDKRARETMYAIKAKINDVLSFEADKEEPRNDA